MCCHGNSLRSGHCYVRTLNQSRPNFFYYLPQNSLWLLCVPQESTRPIHLQKASIQIFPHINHTLTGWLRKEWCSIITNIFFVHVHAYEVVQWYGCDDWGFWGFLIHSFRQLTWELCFCQCCVCFSSANLQPSWSLWGLRWAFKAPLFLATDGRWCDITSCHFTSAAIADR